MRDLFGNPPDGTLLAWFADHGLFAILIVIATVVAWYIIHMVTQDWITRRVTSLQENWLIGDFMRQERLIRWGDEILIGLLVGVPAFVGLLDVLGVDISPALRGWRRAWTEIWPWLREHGFPLFLITGIAYFASRTVARAVPRLMTRVILRAEKSEGDDPAEAARRADTLTAALSGLVTGLIFVVALITLLQEVGVSVGPLLAGLGLVSVAVGFGSQWLVRDIIAGVFIIGENQYRKGDVVEVAGRAGLVEAINLRRTILRDLDGKVHVISNGEIHTSSNFSKGWSRVNLDIQVAYKQNLQHVFDIITETGLQMMREPYWSDVILDAPKPLRVNSFDDSGITIKVLAMTKPLKQWEVAGELRFRLKKRFDEEGIEIPFPHQTIYWGEGANPTTGEVGSAALAQEARRAAAERAQAAASRRTAMQEEASTAAAATAAEKLRKALQNLQEQGRIIGLPQPGGPRQDPGQSKRDADLLSKLDQ